MNSTIEKLQILGGGTKWDACTPSRSSRKVKGDDRIGSPLSAGVCKSFTPDGRCVSLFRVLQSNSCIHDCKFCTHSTGCTNRKETFDPKELGDLFMHMYLGNYVEGLFLTSSVTGNETIAFEKMYETVEYLRNKHKYQGYVHLKVMPGAHQSEIRALAEVADRVSLNIETTDTQAFSEICSTKDYNIDVRRRLNLINKVKHKNEVTSGVTTQMVVGAADETDLDYLNTLQNLYEEHDLKKAYFSAFDSVPGTPLEKNSSIPLKRENFLYRTDWLLRFYHFSFKEVKSALNEDGMLSLSIDPKLQYALNNPDRFPVDVNEAKFEELLRVPGIGLQGAKRIVEVRKRNKLDSVDDLKKTGTLYKRALPFLQVRGSKQSSLRCFS